jgi:hypothetical protein
MIMVDELLVWPNAWGPFKKGSCHLTTDGPIEELHAFAERIGLKRAWFQPHRLMDHYDLTSSRREAALAAGAVFVPGMDQARARRAKRRAAA